MEPGRKKHLLAWLIFGLLSIPYLMVYFHRVAPAVVADRLMADFHLSGAVMGNLAAIYFYVYTLMQVPAGLLADSLGPRWTIFVGMVISGTGSLIFGWAPSLAVAYLGRFLVGLGVSVIFVSILKIVSHWFSPRQFGTMSGITLLVGNAGAVLAATPLAYVVTMWGWRISFVAVGMISLAVAFIVLFVVRDTPAESGFAPPQGESTSTMQADFRGILGALRRVIGNRQSWPPFVVFFGIYGTLMAFQGVWGIPYLVQHFGMERVEAASSLLIVALGVMVGSPLAGATSDLLKRRKTPLLVLTFLYMITWALLLYWPGGRLPSGLLPPLFFAMGFSASGFVIIWACAKEVNPSSMSGSSMGLANMGGFLGAAIMQPLLGCALDRKWKGVTEGGARVYPLEAFHSAFTMALVILVLTSIWIFLIRETYGEMKP